MRVRDLVKRQFQQQIVSQPYSYCRKQDFQRILGHKEQTAITVCQGLAASGVLTATPAEIPPLAINMTVVATFWLSFEHARRPRGEPDIGRGVFQVMSLAAPYLQGESRHLLDKLSNAYINKK